MEMASFDSGISLRKVSGRQKSRKSLQFKSIPKIYYLIPVLNNFITLSDIAVLRIVTAAVFDSESGSSLLRVDNNIDSGSGNQINNNIDRVGEPD